MKKLKSEESPKIIKISGTAIRNIAKEWINYFLNYPYKLFIEDNEFKNHIECLDLISKSNGFQITAFAGKAQNDYTHPLRQPDLGELNLLAKLRAIQILTYKPIRIILDGEYYSKIFHEDINFIKKYEKKLNDFARIIGINTEFGELK